MFQSTFLEVDSWLQTIAIASEEKGLNEVTEFCEERTVKIQQNITIFFVVLIFMFSLTVWHGAYSVWKCSY